MKNDRWPSFQQATEKENSAAMLTDVWNQRLDRHEAFLECRRVDRPVIGFWRSGYYPAEQFPSAVTRWRTGAILQPNEVSFAPFAADYERLYESQHENNGDVGYIGSAYWGIPWLEAIMGCAVEVAVANCCAKPCLTSLDNAEGISLDLDNNAWLDGRIQGRVRNLGVSREAVPQVASRGVWLPEPSGLWSGRNVQAHWLADSTQPACTCQNQLHASYVFPAATTKPG